MTAFMLRQAQHEANFIGPVYSVTFTLSSVTFTLRSVILTLSLSKGEGARRRGYCQGGSELL